MTIEAKFKALAVALEQVRQATKPDGAQSHEDAFIIADGALLAVGKQPTTVTDEVWLCVKCNKVYYAPVMYCCTRHGCDGAVVKYGRITEN